MAQFSFPDLKPRFNQWLLYVGLFLLSLFAWLPNSYTKMLMWPWLLMWQGAFLLVGIWFLQSLRQYQRLWQTLGYGLDWGVIAVGVSVLLSTVTAIEPGAAGWYLVMLGGHGLLLYSLRNWLNEEPFLEYLWVGLCGVGGLSALISLTLWLPQADWLNLRNAMPLGEYGAVGGYFALILPLMVAYMIAHQGWQRMAGCLGSVVVFLALYTTASRSALLAIAIVAALSLVIAVVNLRRLGTLRKLGIHAGAVGVVLLGTAVNPRVFATANWQNIEPSVATQLNLVDSIQSRFLLWATSIDILQIAPLTGLGMGHLGREFDRFRFLTEEPPETSHLFSTPLQILSELGLLGAIASLIFLFLVMRLWLSMLPYLESDSSEAILAYGIGASWVAYGMVCFTDYQLENLAISTTLVATLALLLAIAHKSSPDMALAKTNRQRRGIQMVSLSFLIIFLYLGLPTTIAATFNHQGQLAQKRENSTEQYVKKMAQAQRFTPWQPGYPLDVGMHYWEKWRQQLADGSAPEDNGALLNDIESYFREAAEASSADQLLQYNYGAIAFDSNPEETSLLLSELLENSNNRFPYTQYLLAKSYLTQNIQDEAATKLLALQIIRDPEFFTLPQWQFDPQLQSRRQIVYEQAIADYETLLEQIAPNNSEFQQLYESMVLVKWWQNEFLGQVTLNKLRPSVQAILFAESQPRRALEIINDALGRDIHNRPLQILRAWFDPEFTFNMNDAEGNEILMQQPSTQYDNLQNWFTAVFPSELLPLIPVLDRDKRYRDPVLADISAIIPPTQLEYWPMIRLIELFEDRPSPTRDAFLREQQAALLEAIAEE